MMLKQWIMETETSRHTCSLGAHYLLCTYKWLKCTSKINQCRRPHAYGFPTKKEAENSTWVIARSATKAFKIEATVAKSLTGHQTAMMWCDVVLVLLQTSKTVQFKVSSHCGLCGNNRGSLMLAALKGLKRFQHVKRCLIQLRKLEKENYKSLDALTNPRMNY